MSFDIIHFEALGPEAQHLEEEISHAKVRGELPAGHSYLITPQTIQDFLQQAPDAALPDIISVKTHSIIPDDYFAGSKKSVVTRSAGYDHLEHLSDSVNIASLREYCVNAVAQTAIKFLYAAAGELNHYTVNTRTFERKKSRAFMELDEQRVVTVFGVGKIGKRIYELAKANGLQVQGVDIRANDLSMQYGDAVKFVSKEEAICNSDILINAMNLTKNPTSRFYNVGYFSKDYLLQAEKELIFINITRGEIAPEADLLELYSTQRLMGIGLDVFTSEAQFAEYLQAGKGTSQGFCAAGELVRMSLERTANIYVQPHQGFNSDVAARTKAVEAVKHIIAWYRNGGEFFDEQLPYY